MNILEKIITKAEKDKKILALILFGSKACECACPLSDIDVCIMLYPGKFSSKELSYQKLEYLKEFEDVDIQVFQQLPMYIKKRVLREGKIVFCRDEDTLYNIALHFITEYNDYEHILKEYLEDVQHAR